MEVQSRTRIFFRWLLALLYLAAGIMHIRSPAGFLAITPDWVPYPEQVVFITGVAEIAGAIGLMTQHWRRAAGIGLALYAFCVWPANINHAVNDIAVGGRTLGWGYHAPRLLLQPVIIWWALWASGGTNWPFGQRGDAADWVDP
ncbi:DoxX family protein [Sphingorhabdus sp. Alg239-R122]|uniref:DoxX family protein n=1 Tax=Sphingorhabdus sp. Alg239-R122 TaxID=2305989 RepID=UPI0013D9AE75|nr:DoxX family protein [Sphingorhabdus sp. Alg239-R122]